jgi:hypothetical protein
MLTPFLYLEQQTTPKVLEIDNTDFSNAIYLELFSAAISSSSSSSESESGFIKRSASLHSDSKRPSFNILSRLNEVKAF